MRHVSSIFLGIVELPRPGTQTRAHTHGPKVKLGHFMAVAAQSFNLSVLRLLTRVTHTPRWPPQQKYEFIVKHI